MWLGLPCQVYRTGVNMWRVLLADWWHHLLAGMSLVKPISLKQTEVACECSMYTTICTHVMPSSSIDTPSSPIWQGQSFMSHWQVTHMYITLPWCKSTKWLSCASFYHIHQFHPLLHWLGVNVCVSLVPRYDRLSVNGVTKGCVKFPKFCEAHQTITILVRGFWDASCNW